MELLLLVLIAGVVGYLLAGSRFSKPIDETAQKVTQTTQNAAKTTGGWLSGVGTWFQKTLKFEKKPQNEVVDIAEMKTEESGPTEFAPTATKQPSRRRGNEMTDEQV